MCVSVRRRFAASANAPGSARNFAAAAVISALTPRGWQVSEDVALVISEFVTIAVQAGADDIDVEVDVHDGRIDVGIVDDGDHDRPVPALDDRHLARRLLDQVAERWRMGPTADGRIAVRVALGCDRAATAQLECTRR
jgi:anti-sigma regulatory factor (Ser/Thr protein kinase)